MGIKSQKRISFAQIIEQTKQASVSNQHKLAPLFLSGMGQLTPDGTSMEQLGNAQRLLGMKAVFAFPDLHPGKGIPIGATCVSQGLFYPHLAGSDIGCGILLCKLQLFKKPIFERLAQLDWLKEALDSESLAALNQLALGHPSAARRHGVFSRSLGTIGGGNHFGEIGQAFDCASDSPFNEGDFSLLVHTGSRLMGDRMAWAWAQKHQATGVVWPSAEAQEWLEDQQFALEWARLNRMACARSIAHSLGADIQSIADVWHNGIEKVQSATTPSWGVEGCSDYFIHRKGASRSDPLIPLPTNRGEPSALLCMINPSLEQNGFSCAHGAGRKWRRSECKERLEERFSLKDLRRTDIGGFVYSPNVDLLWEEAPQAYKSGKAAIEALQSAQLASPLCLLRPRLTLKS